jgi:hypothetical protein
MLFLCSPLKNKDNVMPITSIEIETYIPAPGVQHPSEIVVSGTATGCTTVDVWVENQLTGEHTTVKTSTIESGNWSVIFLVSDGDFESNDFTCGDQQKIIVHAICVDDGTGETIAAFERIDCTQRPPNCPVIGTFDVDISDICNIDDTRTVAVSAQVTPSGETTVAQWYFVRTDPDPEVIPGISALITTTETVSDSADLTGGKYNIELRIIAPANCLGALREVEVDPCDLPCPTITFGPIVISEYCDDSDNRLVDFSVTVTGVPEHSLSGELRDENDNLLASGADDDDDGVLVLSFTDVSFAPGSHALSLTMGLENECGENNYLLEIQPCPEVIPCPAVSVGLVSIGDCNDDDKRPLSVTVELSGDPGDPIQAHIEDQNGTVLVSGSDDDNDGQLNLVLSNVAFDPGTYTLKVINETSNDCGIYEFDVVIEPCTEPEPRTCPSVSVGPVMIGDCNETTGARPVSVEVELTATPGEPLSGRLTDASGVVLVSASDDDNDGTLILALDNVEFTPGQHLIKVDTGQEDECGETEIEIDIQPCCPDITFSQTVGDCNDNDQRPVTVTASVTVIQGPVEAVLTDNNGNQVDSATSQGSSVSLSDTQTLSPGAYTFQVSVTEPEGCTTDSRLTVTVPPCVDTVIDWCSILKFLILLGSGLCLLGLSILLCPQGASPAISANVALYIGIGLIVLGLLILVIAIPIWFFMCRPSECDWFNIGWQIFGLAALVFFYISLCPACGNLMYIALSCAIIAVASFWVWVGRCRPDSCRIFDELLLFFINADIIEGLETILANCVISTNLIGALVWWALLALGTYIAYAGQREYCR